MTQNGSSLSERAMLVDFTVRCWTANVHDKAVSEEVARGHGASSRRVGRYQKQVLPEEALEEVAGIARAASRDNARLTLPWTQKGERILSSAAYMDVPGREGYATLMRRHRAAFDAAVERFVVEYPRYVAEAPARMGSLYKPSDYPDTTHVRGKFNLGYQIAPLPDPQDFRVQLGDEERAAVVAQLEAVQQDALAGAQRALVERLYAAVERVAERLTAYSVSCDGVAGAFRDTLVTGLRELVGLVPALNIAEDPGLEALRTQIETQLCAYDPDVLRESEQVRLSTAEAADQILEQLDGYLA